MDQCRAVHLYGRLWICVEKHVHTASNELSSETCEKTLLIRSGKPHAREDMKHVHFEEFAHQNLIGYFNLDNMHV